MKESEEIFEISELITKELSGNSSEKERTALNEWLQESSRHQEIFDEIRNEILRPDRQQYSDEETEQAFQRFMKCRQRREKRARRLSWYKYAAMWMLPLCIGGILWQTYRHDKESVQTSYTSISTTRKKPVLTLASGKEILLDNHSSLRQNRELQQLIAPDSGNLVYTGLPSSPDHLEYHTLETPSQCDYHFILSDGTKVWINAESSLKYPVAFGKEERTIFAQGEIYLEVAKDTSRPFFVVTEDIKVRVLGTSFNVNAYANNDYTAVTLVEGKVAASTKNNTYELLPNRQLHFDRQSQKAVINPVHVEHVISWKDGRYIFKGQSLEKVAKVLERWYAVQIVFDNPQARGIIYTGIVDKEEKLEDFIVRLNETSDLTCLRNGNSIHIKKR